VKILAFDTSTPACTIALLDDNRITSTHQVAPMQQAKLILPFIQDLLTAAALPVAALDAIAYGCGPGSFTGVRIASSVAQGLGYAINKPIIPISSLAILAQTAFHERQITPILVAVDARMREIYWAMYSANSQGQVELIGKEQICVPEMITLPAGQNWHGVGDGWKIYGDRLINQLGFRPHTVNAEQLPNAEAMLVLTKAGKTCVASEALPVYLR
jgi:tRNA threonylcarbamoyladenosine biosynthesis protein TsaB